MGCDSGELTTRQYAFGVPAMQHVVAGDGKRACHIVRANQRKFSIQFRLHRRCGNGSMSCRKRLTSDVEEC